MTYCVLHLSKKKSFRLVGTHKPDGWSVGWLTDFISAVNQKRSRQQIFAISTENDGWLLCDLFVPPPLIPIMDDMSLVGLNVCHVLFFPHTHTPFMISSIWVRKPLLFGCPKCECLWANDRSGRVGCMRGEKQNHIKNFRFELLQRTILFFFFEMIICI